MPDNINAIERKQRNRRRILVGFAVIVAATAIWFGKNRNAGPDPQKLVGFRIAASSLGNPEQINKEARVSGPLGYAIHLGGFEGELNKAGFRFDGIVGFPRTAAALLGMMSGQAELASTGDSPAVLSRARGEKHRAIYVTRPHSAESSFWVIGRKGAPDSIAELGGHSVGLLFGSTFDYSFQTAAEGLQLKNIAYRQLPSSAALAALQNNELDSYVTSPTVGKLWVDKYGLKLIGRLGDVPSAGKIVSVISAREDFLAANPAFAAAFWRGLKTGIDAIRRDPESYFRWEADATGYSIDIIRATSKLDFEDRPISEDGVAALKSLLDFRVKHQVAKSSFPVDDWVLRQ